MTNDVKVTFFAYGHGGWGKADNLQEAIKLAKLNTWSRKSRLTNNDFTVTVYLCAPEEITVGDFAVFGPEDVGRIKLWEAKQPK